MRREENGIFTISLDFELYWGMRDVSSIEAYAHNLRGVPAAIDALLESFGTYDIHATWAIVGFLYFSSLEELKKHLPERLPAYAHKEYDLYHYINTHTSLEPLYHFAPDIIKKIGDQENQEIGTHTFSHYYCLEEGQNREEFRSDIEYAVRTAKEQMGKETKSLVFPRNQWNEEYLSVLSDLHLLCYRGNAKSWVYNAVNQDQNLLVRRAVKLMDSYINLTGHNTYDLKSLSSPKLLNIPSSSFLRPVSKKLSLLESLRLKRIKKSMTYAAQNSELFHLWWHPHNFGVEREANVAFLVQILEHYKKLKSEYNMKSLSMGEVALLLKGLDNEKEG